MTSFCSTRELFKRFNYFFLLFLDGFISELVKYSSENVVRLEKKIFVKFIFTKEERKILIKKRAKDSI